MPPKIAISNPNARISMMLARKIKLDHSNHSKREFLFIG